MDIWSVHERKAEQLQARMREQQLRDLIGRAYAGDRWRQRTALRCGLLLLRLGRRLIRYGTPRLDSVPDALPALRHLR